MPMVIDLEKRSEMLMAKPKPRDFVKVRRLERPKEKRWEIPKAKLMPTDFVTEKQTAIQMDLLTD